VRGNPHARPAEIGQIQTVSIVTKIPGSGHTSPTEGVTQQARGITAHHELH